MLLINNDEIARVLTMRDTMAALEQSYALLASGEAVCRPRVDIAIPTSDPQKTYRWGTMEGGSTGGYFAIRMKSDIVYRQTKGDVTTEEKYCVRPGLFCGLIFLTSIETGEPLALINDGVLQHMRVGADGGLGVKYMARADAEVVGMLGSGGMARAHMEAFTQVRKIKRLQVYSPTPEHRRRFGDAMAQQYGIEVEVCDRPEDVYRGAHIVAGLTDSAIPVLDGRWLEPGAHIVNIGGGGTPDGESLKRVDRYLRFGDAPAPLGRPEFGVSDEFITYAATRPGVEPKGKSGRGHGAALPDRMVTLAEVLSGGAPARASNEQITWSERGNLQGAQFYAVAGRAYELAKAAGLGRDIPTDWLLQDIRN
jgi:alanine dehydrogenase